MYRSGSNGLGDFSTILEDVLNTGEQIFRDSRTPVTTNPTFRLPTTPPFINPTTGQFLPASNYTMPLLIGAGVLALVLLTRRK
jgi:hypothetical protein